MRNYMLTIIPCESGGVYLCDDEGNRDWYRSVGAALATLTPARRATTLVL